MSSLLLNVLRKSHAHMADLELWQKFFLSRQYLKYLKVYLKFLKTPFKGTVMQIEKALINDCLRVSQVP